MSPVAQVDESKAEAHFSGKLQPGERLLWAGQPVRFRINRLAIVAYAAGLSLAAFWVGICLGALVFSWPSVFNFSGFAFASFAVIGFLITSRMLIGIYRSTLAKNEAVRRTYYAVTDRRVLVDSAENQPQYDFSLAGLSGVTKVIHPDGTGSLIMAKIPQGQSFLIDRGVSLDCSNIEIPAFFDISDPESVYELIDQNLQTWRRHSY
jgi:hypothetical protein